MNLRTRFLVGYGYLVVLLLIMAASAAVGSQLITSHVERMINENAQGVQRAVRILETLERNDSAVLSYLLGSEEADEEVTAYEDELERLIQEAMTESNTPEITLVLARMGELLRSYQQERVVLFTQDRTQGGYTAPQEEMNVLFRELKDSVYLLLELHYDRTWQAGEDARQLSQGVLLWIGFMVVLALISMGFVTRFLQDKFLRRLVEASRVVSQISAGDTSRRLPAEINDELGALARQLNSTLDKQVETQEGAQARVLHQRQLVLALLPHLSQYTAILGPDGDLVASRCPERMLERLPPIADWIRKVGRERIVKQESLEGIEESFEAPGKPTLHVRLLLAPVDRPVGWLISLQPRARMERSTGAVEAVQAFDPQVISER